MIAAAALKSAIRDLEEENRGSATGDVGAPSVASAEGTNREVGIAPRASV
jgi:hypothetical protein